VAEVGDMLAQKTKQFHTSRLPSCFALVMSQPVCGVYVTLCPINRNRTH